MKLTPIDVSHRTFNRKMFGFDEVEVKEFLEQAAQALEAVVHERNLLREQLREREIQLQEYKDKEATLRSTVAAASQMSERIRQDSEREAQLILQDSQQKAEIILRDSRDSLKKIYQEIADLKRTRMQFEANLKALAQAHLSLLDQADKYMPAMGLHQVKSEDVRL